VLRVASAAVERLSLSVRALHRALRVARTFDSVGPRPWGLALSPSGDRLYTANGPSDDVSVIDVASGEVVRRIAAGKLPWGVVIAP